MTAVFVPVSAKEIALKEMAKKFLSNLIGKMITLRVIENDIFVNLKVYKTADFVCRTENDHCLPNCGYLGGNLPRCQ